MTLIKKILKLCGIENTTKQIRIWKPKRRNMQTTGIIKSIEKTEHVTERFSTRRFVLEIDYDKQYSQLIEFQLHNDRTDMIDAYTIGQTVAVDFELKGKQHTKEGETKTFNTLKVWKIQPAK